MHFTLSLREIARALVHASWAHGNVFADERDAFKPPCSEDHHDLSRALNRLVTLAVQNASLALIMHYSRISTSPTQTYSAASAVLLNELLKGSISFVIAFSHIQDHFGPHHTPRRYTHVETALSWMQPSIFLYRLKTLRNEIFSPDCWKLSIPAILYGAHIDSQSQTEC